MGTQSMGRRCAVDRAIWKHSPRHRVGSSNFYQFISTVRHRSDVLSYESWKSFPACNSVDDVVEKLLWLCWYRRDLKRPTHQWQPIAGSAFAQFRSLAKHMYAQYDVPEYLLGAAHAADVAALVDIGGGKSVRLAFPQCSLSKSVAHALWKTPVDLTGVVAIAWAQSIVWKLSERLARELVTLPEATAHFGTPFWKELCLFFVSCERESELTLRAGEAAEIWAFIKSIRFDPASRLVGYPPMVDDPLLPGFSVAGKGLRWMRRRMANWKQEIEWPPRRKPGRHNDRTWGRCSLPEFKIEHQDELWSISELCSTLELRNESGAMSHCVREYDGLCAENLSSIWSVRKRRSIEGDERTRRVVTVEVDTQDNEIVQVKGRCNSTPSDATVSILAAWASHVGLRFDKESTSL